MFSRYFKEAEKKFIQQFQPLPAKKGAARKTTVKYDEFSAFIESVLPEPLCAAHAAVRDRSGYTSDTADFVVFHPVARATALMLGSVIPSELAAGAFHMVPSLDRKTLLESLVRSAQIKKCDRYEGREDEPGFIASFVVAFGSGYSLPEIRDTVIETYTSQDVAPDFEADIIAVLGKGLLAKKWGETRSYAAVETGPDTLMWFYILMREYLETGKAGDIDLRSLVLDQGNYPEY